MFYSKPLTTSFLKPYLLLVCLALCTVKSGAVYDGITQRIANAEELRIKGHLPQALSTLQNIKDTLPVRSQNHTLVMGLIANIYLQQGQLNEAFIILSETQLYAQKQGWDLLAGDQSLMLANLYIQQGNIEKAQSQFAKTNELAGLSGDQKTSIQAAISLARLKFKITGSGDFSELLTIQQQIRENTAEISPQIRLNWVQLMLEVEAAGLTEEAFRQLEFVLKDQENSNFYLSQAYGLMAQLYTKAGRHQEAITLLNKAIFAAQVFPELLFKWEWQLGDTLQRVDNTEDAIAALRRAVNHVEAIRQDIPVDYVDGRSSFRATLEPLYLQLTDLLLRHARESRATSQKQALLADARATIELLKRSELEDYFDNRCVIGNEQEIDLTSVAQNTAAIYPIMLPDRLELLVSLGNKIEQRTIAVSAGQIQQSAKALASRFRSLAPDYQTLSMQFYQWLIAPIQPILQQNNIETLIYLPDGALRLVPMASLYSGSEFLIEQYGVVTSPGLTMFEATPTDKDDFSVLLAGLSAPGPVVDDVSERLYSAINVASGSQLHSNLQNRMAFPRQRREEHLQLATAINDDLSEVKRRLRIKSRTPVLQSRSMMSLSAQELRLKNNRPQRIEQALSNKTLVKKKLKIVNKTLVVGSARFTNESSPLRIKGKYPDAVALELARLARASNNPLRIVNKKPVVELASNSRLTQQYLGLVDSAVTSQLRIKKRSLPNDAAQRLQIKNNQIARLKQRLALPGVTTEIENISKLYDGTVLLNDNFGKQAFIDNMLSDRYDVVHIASHGVFGDSAENSFVMTHDELLDMDQLEQLLSHEKFEKAPIDLITLSACQTADGDDRAPLGISGIALRAKVRSAVGALWAVSDAATVELMSEFYVNLRKPGMTKAEALRQAQISMVKKDQYQHPFFWSAFILIGNWM